MSTPRHQAPLKLHPGWPRLLALLALAVMAAGCGRRPAREPAEPVSVPSSPAVQQLHAGAEGANLIIIVLDAARADHFGGLGYGMETTPHADELFESAVLFTRAYAEAPNTKASIASLFTSQFPDTHGSVGVGMPLSAEPVTLAEVMKSQGYVTAAFSANPYLAEWFGFDRGFDDFYEVFREVHLEPNEPGGVPAELMLEAALPWLRAHADQRFFAYLHFLQPHAPYDPPSPFRYQFMHPPDYLMGLYDGNLAYADDHLGQLLDEIERLGLEDKSLVVLLADHGEAFGEHGRFGHTTTVFEEMIHVPLAFRLPPACGATPQRRAEVIGLTEVMPTLLDLYGIDAPEGMQGRSRLGLLAGEVESAPAITVSRSMGMDPSGGVDEPEEVRYALTSDRYTLILGNCGNRVALFDRENDPGQHENIADDNPEIVSELRRQFEDWAATQRGRPVVLPGGRTFVSGEPAIAMDEQLDRQLRSLGYVK